MELTQLQLTGASETVLNQLLKKVRMSYVFLDDVSAEYFHWYGGIDRLLDAGAKCVKHLSPLESVPQDCKKAVFINSSFVHDVEAAIHSIIKSSGIEYCIIATIGSHGCHFVCNNGWDWSKVVPGTPCFDALEIRLLESMGNANYTVEIINTPFFGVDISTNFFLLLPFVKLRCPLNTLEFGTDFSRLSHSSKCSVELLVSTLNNILSNWNMSEQCYSIGPFSQIIANRLYLLPAARTRRKTAQTKASLIFIDRTADLISPLSGVASGNIVDKLFFHLKPFSGHRCDRAVHVGNTNSVPPGCLYHYSDKNAKHLFEVALFSSRKDVIDLCTKQITTLIKDTDAHIERPIHGDGSLKGLIERALNNSNIAEFAGTVQFSQGVFDSILNADATEDFRRWTEVVKSVNDVIKNSKLPLRSLKSLITEKKLVSVDHLLLAIVTIFSASSKDSFTWEQQDYEACESILADYILEHWADFVNWFSEMSTELKAFLESNIDEVVALQVARKIIVVLRNVARVQASVVRQKCYLSEVAAKVVHPTEPIPSELEVIGQGLTDVLKSSFGMFVNLGSAGRPPRPSDSSVIIIFCVGGITASEIEEIKRICHVTSGLKLLIGSTKLLGVRSLICDIFSDCFIHEA